MFVLCYKHTLQLDEVTTYEERSAIRKLLRDRKKSLGGGSSSGTRRGTGGYNRYVPKFNIGMSPPAGGV